MIHASLQVLREAPIVSEIKFRSVSILTETC